MDASSTNQTGALRARARAIPEHTTPLVGRRFVLEQLDNAVSGQFATVLWGTAGVGKSRLAHAYAAQWYAARGDGDVWVVDLGDARGEADAVARVASVVGLPAGMSPVQTLAHIGRLLGRARPALLVLDHCEQIADQVAAWADVWARDAAAGPARVLATSRRTIAGFGALAAPGLTEDEALRLVEARARRVRESFRLDATTSNDLRQLIRGVDALPAALELLAGRLMLLSPRQLLERLDDGAGRLDAALERSWELLEPRLQQVLLQLAVTRGGFDVELAEEFLRVEQGDALSALETLVQHAWLHPVDDGGTRLRLLHEVQRFVVHKGVPSTAGLAFARALTDRAERWDAAIETDEEQHATQQLVANLPNLWAAWDLAADAHLRARIGVVLHMALQRGGAFERQDEVTVQTLSAAREAGDDELVARALLARARVLRWQGDATGAAEALEQSLVAGDAATRCCALRNLAAVTWGLGDPVATRAWAEKALQAARDEGEPVDEINALNGLGYLLTSLGERAQARALLERALELALQPERPSGLVALVSSSLAWLEAHEGQWLAAERHSSRALGIYERLGYRRQVPLELLYRAEARLAAGRIDAARADVEAADEIAARWAYDALSLRASYVRGVALVAAGEAAAAIDVLEQAAARLGAREDTQLATEVAIALGAAWRCAGAPERSTSVLAEVEDAMARWLDGRAEEPPEPVTPLRAVLVRAVVGRRRVLEVGPEGRVFRVDDGEPIDLTRRKALRGMLAALAAGHGGPPLSNDDLLEAGWPGEVMTVESGQQRIYVTIKRLRDLGLGDVLITVGDGYALDPSWSVRAATGRPHDAVRR